MTCDENCKQCKKENDFKYDYCCLFECNEHEFCRGCDRGVNSLSKYADAIDKFLTFLRNCQSDYDIYKSQISDCDNATQDILHYIELSYVESNDDINNKLVDLLKDTRTNRRKAKKHIQALESIINWISANSRTINELQKLLGDERKTLRNLRNRFYNNKTNILDCINNDITDANNE